MKRLAASASIAGLGIMSAVTLLLCRTTGLALETRIVLFLCGALLFVGGSSGYTTAQR
jgi:hypothetical protein